ncbi:MAG: hypothetical protein HXX14_14730 [Bacteroidetes bacterium]|nr:hypothetical protein [Bacteroidota bacterium]
MKNRIFYCFTALTLVISSVNGQKAYNDYAPANKQALFTETFSDGKAAKWDAFDKGDGKIVNGIYRIQREGNEPSVSWITASTFDVKRDFEIEASICLEKGEPKGYFNGIIWGKQADAWNYFLYGLNENDKYVVAQTNPNWVAAKEWTPSTLIKHKQYNKLTIRKVANTLYYFINESLVFSGPFETLFGNQFGIQSAPGAILMVKEFKISYLQLVNKAVDKVKPSPVSTGASEVAASATKPETVQDNKSTADQSAIKGQNYFDIPVLSKQDIAYDEFNTVDADRWYIGQGETNCNIKDGEYIIEQTTNQPTILYANTDAIDQQRDFEIEAMIKLEKGDPNEAGSGLIWGKEASRFYFFGFNQSGFLVVAKNNPTWTILQDWEKHFMLNKKEYNLLTVRKVAGTMFCFINMKLFYTGPYQPFFGTKLGFYVAPQSTLKIKEFRTSYLK